MAKKDNRQNPSIPRSILNRLTSLRRQMNGVYRDTYATDPSPKDELDRIGSDIEDHISKVLSRNGTDDVANISKLYAVANLRNNLDDANYNKEIVSFFEDRSITDQLVNSYLENKWVKALDDEYDVVCKYFPKLQEALDAIKDSVLTADNFDKEYLSFTSPNVSGDELSKFNQEIESYKKQYDLYEKADKWYSNASKYGEQFVYKVPYNKALAILLNRRSQTRYNGTGYAGMGVRECSILTEGAIPKNLASNKDASDYFLSAKKEFANRGIRDIKLEIVKDSVLESAVNESKQMRDMLVISEQTSVHEAGLDKNNEIISPTIFDMPSRLKVKKKDETAADGLVGTEKISPSKLKVPGLLLKELKRENVIMLYMDDICLGYYYIEFMDREGGLVFQDNLFQKKTLSSIGYGAGTKLEDEQIQKSATDDLLKYLASAIVANLDDKFINNNPYLKKEIYSVLKYNDMFNSEGVDKIRVTYLAPNDVEHIKFKEDPDTHRGISDIAAGLIPAKLYCCIYICNVLGILTRGQDKRVYYVKQNVEQNIAQTLLNVINQIKKQNMNIMQIENMNSILGITGKYNDYIIPVGPSGDAPIQMEVMEGQNIDPQTELLEKLEEAAINATGIPIELVNARLQLDFATQLTMSNTKFMRFIFKRQAKFETFLGNIMTDIYNTEQQNDADKVTVKCVLPSPIMFNVNNLNQILELVTQQAQAMADLVYADTNDQDVEIKKNIYKKHYVQFKLGTYLKQNELDIIKTKSDMEFEQMKTSEDEN